MEGCGRDIDVESERVGGIWKEKERRDVEGAIDVESERVRGIWKERERVRKQKRGEVMRDVERERV